MDHMSDPVVMPDASANPARRPWAMDVPARANVAGPGLANAISAANRMRGRLMSKSTASSVWLVFIHHTKLITFFPGSIQI